MHALYMKFMQSIMGFVLHHLKPDLYFGKCDRFCSLKIDDLQAHIASKTVARCELADLLFPVRTCCLVDYKLHMACKHVL